MRKPRDYDAELKGLEAKAKELKTRKVLQLGELVTATGALIVLAETTDTGKREAWAKRGAAFFQGRSRKPAKANDRNAESTPAQSGGAQPGSGDKGAA